MIRGFSFSLFELVGSLLAASAAPTQAAELRRVEYFLPAVECSPSPEAFCPWRIRDAISADTKVIAHLEANPAVAESEKGALILGEPAEVHYLRLIAGPMNRITTRPCC